MEFIRKTLKIILSVSLIFCSGCNLSNEEQRTELSGFHINESKEDRNGSFEEIAVSEPVATTEKDITTDDKMLFSTTADSVSIPHESSMEEVISFNEPDSSEDITELNEDNRHSYGAIDPEIWGEFIVPENWREILTTEEAFERFDEITAPLPEGDSPEDEIVLLMNRNVLCFDTAYVNSFEFIDSAQGLDYRSDDILHVRVRSEYFSTIQDIKNLYAQTYTEECANRLFYGTEDRPLQTFIKDENGIIWVDMRCVLVWSTSPFYNPSYIEIVSQSESDCEFLWHYVSYDYGDYFTDYLPHEFFPFHNQIKCYAVKENDEWKLTFLIYDNPTYME